MRRHIGELFRRLGDLESKVSENSVRCFNDFATWNQQTRAAREHAGTVNLRLDALERITQKTLEALAAKGVSVDWDEHHVRRDVPESGPGVPPAGD